MVRNHYSGTIQSPVDGDALFLDRNPTVFHDVLDLLCGVEIPITERLRQELVYFALEPQVQVAVPLRDNLRQLFLDAASDGRGPTADAMSTFGIIRDTLVAALKDEAQAGKTCMELSSSLLQSFSSVMFKIGLRTFMLDQVSCSRCRTGWKELARLIEINLGVRTWSSMSEGMYIMRCDWSNEVAAEDGEGIEKIHSLLQSVVEKGVRIIK